MLITDIQHQAMMILMMKGDPRAKIALKSRIKKVEAEPKDHHMVGTLGTVMGSIQSDEIGEAYLVHFDGDAEHVLSFIIGRKIETVEPA